MDCPVLSARSTGSGLRRASRCASRSKSQTNPSASAPRRSRPCTARPRARAVDRGRVRRLPAPGTRAHARTWQRYLPADAGLPDCHHPDPDPSHPARAHRDDRHVSHHSGGHGRDAARLGLAPGARVTLLRGGRDGRRGLVGAPVGGLGGLSALTPSPPAMSLDSLATAGMSRPLALLKTASLTNARARQRHETLAAAITLVDRLVTDAVALRLLVSSTSSAPMRESLIRVADACAGVRHALAEHRWPESAETAARPTVDPGVAAVPPLADMERTLEQLSVTARVESPRPATKETGPHLLLPDATTNPEYVRFAVKGALAALICYVLFIGFDYPGIYTSVITCFVVSLSTIGSSNQKGLLRFGGAAVGGGMGLVALVD